MCVGGGGGGGDRRRLTFARRCGVHESYDVYSVIIGALATTNLREVNYCLT